MKQTLTTLISSLMPMTLGERMEETAKELNANGMIAVFTDLNGKDEVAPEYNIQGLTLYYTRADMWIEQPMWTIVGIKGKRRSSITVWSQENAFFLLRNAKTFFGNHNILPWIKEAN